MILDLPKTKKLTIIRRYVNQQIAKMHSRLISQGRVGLLPEGLVSGPEGLRPLLLGGLEGSERRGSFLGGVPDPRLPALLLGDREEELAEEDRERERLLVDKIVFFR